MKSSFQRGRSAAASMAAQARFPENQVARGTTGTPSVPGFRDAGLDKDATKRDPRALGAALRFFRGERSLARVAGAAGTKRGHLSAIEKGETSPRPATLGRLADVLGVAIPEICALADLLSLNPAILGSTAGPADLRAIEAAVRWATLLRDAEPALLPFMQPFSVGGRQPWATPDADAHREAAALWERLRPYAAAERRAIVQEGEEYQVWALCLRLCEECIEAAPGDPAEALELARLAELIAPLVAGSDAFRSRLTGYCAFHVSRAHHAGGSLPASAETLQRAETLWSAGSAGDPGERLAEARILGLKATLHGERRHLP